MKNSFRQEKLNHRLTHNPGLALTGFRTTWPRSIAHEAKPNGLLTWDFDIFVIMGGFDIFGILTFFGIQGGILTFSKKIAVKFPTPGKNVRSNITEIPCPGNDLWSRARTKIQISLPPDSKIIQMLYPRAKAIDQNPTVCPASPPPA